ncbi:hypothetical protein MMC25_001680 [Agyrium rufum]|nr:hypothetical protein [Agyrium rufum]
MAAEKVDLLIIGAGWHGLAVAKTYLEVHPDTNLVILDSSESIGGVWCKERLYPGLKSNNLHGTYEFSDFPMDEETFGVSPGQHVPGPVVHKYLLKYAEQHDILRRIRFRWTVNSVERKEDRSWLIRTSKTAEHPENTVEQAQYRAISSPKLVFATGLTSQPFLPTFNGSETFNAPIFHVKDMRRYTDKKAQPGKNVIVLGASKSGYDAVYAHVTAGTTVDWIVRESGSGPVWMAPAYVTPLKQRFEKLVGIRCLTWLNPCIWGDNDGFGKVRRLLHETRVGRWFVDSFWTIITNDVLRLSRYGQHPETAKLTPWTPAFWTACSLSLLNYPTDFFQYVRDGKVKIHVADVVNLSDGTVELSNGDSLHGDALICATGWKHRPAIEFLPSGIGARLGLPHDERRLDDDDQAARVRKADLTVLERLPRLASQPTIGRKQLESLKGNETLAYMQNPYRLYHFMVPPEFINDRSIAFAGAMLSIHTVMCAQVQALWLTAYFSNCLLADLVHLSKQIPLESASTKEVSQLGNRFDMEEVKWEATLHSQFGRWRYPAGHGRRFPDLVFDAVPYLDGLMKDLGLRFRRKGVWWREWFEPYGVGDYKDLVDEWKKVAGT